MGNTCKPMAVSFQCMTKSTTNKKKKRSFVSSYIFEERKNIIIYVLLCLDYVMETPVLVEKVLNINRHHFILQALAVNTVISFM